MELNNGATVTIINSLGIRGNISPRAKSFLEYVNDKTVRDDFTEEVDAVVAALKRDSEARRQYMLLKMALHDERMEGRAEGRSDTALKMLKYKESLSKIITYSSLSKEEIYALARKHGLTVVE